MLSLLCGIYHSSPLEITGKFPECLHSSRPGLDMDFGSIEEAVAKNVPLSRETVKRPIEDPVSELRYLSARKSVVWGEMSRLGRELCEWQNEHARICERETRAAEMIEAPLEQ